METRVIGTFGYCEIFFFLIYLLNTLMKLKVLCFIYRYLAPEYAQSGQITEKADVYSFGVVLVELITGRKAMDIKRPKGQQCLTEWVKVQNEHQSFSL